MVRDAGWSSDVKQDAVLLGQRHVQHGEGLLKQMKEDMKWERALIPSLLVPIVREEEEISLPASSPAWPSLDRLVLDVNHIVLPNIRISYARLRTLTAPPSSTISVDCRLASTSLPFPSPLFVVPTTM